MKEADYLEMQLTLFTKCKSPRGGDTRSSLYGKTLLEHLLQIKEPISELCLKKSDKRVFQCLTTESGQKQEWCSFKTVKSHGECWTLNIGEYPSEEKESFLSQILQGNVQEKYYLSSRSCQGILRRAKERGKNLPPMLEKALIAQSCECGVDARGGGKVPLVSNEKSLTLATGNNLPVVHSYCIAGNTIDRKPQNGGNGTGNQEELSYTLNTVDRHAVAECFPQNAYNKFLQGIPLATLKACGGSCGGGSENLIVNISPSVGKVRRLTPTECQNGVAHQEYEQYAVDFGRAADRIQMNATKSVTLLGLGGGGGAKTGLYCLPQKDVDEQKYLVRRLTPVECERLQGLPDGFTDIEFKGKPALDSKRYKALGNGMAQPCADYVIKQIVRFVNGGFGVNGIS